jgi:Tetratricopeptide repeat
VSSINDLAWLLNDEGHYVEAEKLEWETLDFRRQVLGREHQETLISMRHLAWILEQEGRCPEAEKLGRDALGIEPHVLGPEHPDTLIVPGVAEGSGLSTRGRAI